MRIVLTSHAFLPDSSAGTEILTLHTARELKRMGHEVSVYTSRYGSGGKKAERSFIEYEYEGIPVVCLCPGKLPEPYTEIGSEAEYNSSFVKQHFDEYLKAAKPDVVHFFHLAHITAALIDVCHRHHVPMVFTPTDFWFMCPAYQLRLPNGTVCEGPDAAALNCFKHSNRSFRPKAARLLKHLPLPILRGLFAWLNKHKPPSSRIAQNILALQNRQSFIRAELAKIDRVIVPSNTLLSKLKASGLNESQIVFSRYGIDLAPYQGFRKLSLNNPLTIGFIGTLAEHKGAHVLLKAFSKLPADLAVRLKLYGHIARESTYIRSLRRIAGNDTRVEFCGGFPNAKIGEIMQGIDLLCIPSIWLENTPLVLLSALAAGVPVVASGVGGLAEMIEPGGNGHLFPVGDHEQLSRVLQDLIQRPQTILQMSEKILAPKSIESYAEEMHGIYQQLAPPARAA